MTQNPTKAFVFDVYGTLFDVYSVADKCNQYFPEKGEQISKTWREKQLEYTNLRQIMGNYKNFYSITKDALHFAVRKYGEEINEKAENELLKEYLYLTPYSEVKEVLNQLKNKKLAVFSNGSHDMLDPLIEKSELSGEFDQIISADEVKHFKPTIESYHYVSQILEVKPEEVLFISSNGWDISGAKNYGFQTAWINRQNLPTEELNLEPNIIYQDLSDILEWK
ncbi:haloacid dehalogenase type II [Staphylococcus devriesei]|uniref:Haloacid dehalogenase type II n=1 Tax=Staphylococcus devriesei TaxID=586733 RepID=A0A2T4L666_9STAP|nr:MULTISPECIES: haloacid dehalogenase type II [Staphylococcus]HDJ7625356.1 haloacid dehalogenase type II [Staphylococcus aureus]MDU0440566.1 haloacid dehalogenase type II [Staphylococcus haemolyticus]MDU0445649.1 haloacid dehalogenase type II [Staphylococcus haemolyticus]PTE73235.1 haloacid dehalogenase type II [Staphylococcus devriesei]PTF12568.1 haloacid dehalogenase type II [Staphylococcus devriesei]